MTSFSRSKVRPAFLPIWPRHRLNFRRGRIGALVSSLDRRSSRGTSGSQGGDFRHYCTSRASRGAYRLRRRSIHETIDAVLAHGRDYQMLSAQREIASWLAAALDARVRDSEKAEEARNKARRLSSRRRGELRN